MSIKDLPEMKVDRTRIAVYSSFVEAEKADREYWLSRTPQERVSHTLRLRRMNYGDRATERLQRVYKITTIEYGSIPVDRRLWPLARACQDPLAYLKF